MLICPPAARQGSFMMATSHDRWIFAAALELSGLTFLQLIVTFLKYIIVLIQQHSPPNKPSWVYSLLASMRRTSLVIGRVSRVRVPAKRNLTVLTRPSESGEVCTTIPRGHWFRTSLSSRSRTTSPIWKFLCTSVHFCRCCKEFRNSFRHLRQNSFARCCTRLHLFLA